MYKIIKTHTGEANTEARLAEIDGGYIIGTWDLDCQEYYFGLRIFPHSLEGAFEKASMFFDEYIKGTKMHINKLHSILKKAGLSRRTYRSAGRGYRPVLTDGYVIAEKKTSNPEWGFGPKRPIPKFLPTGIFEIDSGPYDTAEIERILNEASIEGVIVK